MSRPSILLVEDEPIIALDLEMFLSNQGYEVAGPFYSVADTLAQLPSLALAGAILDVHVRGETSFPVADRLLEVGTPFVLMSGNSRWLLPKRFRNHPFFAKPFRRQELLEAVRVSQSKGTAP